MAGKPGRPTKFSKTIQPHIQKMATRGFTDAEMAQILGVTEHTFCNWKLKYKSFFQSLSDWKLRADSEIERSLYERAHGYSHPDSTPKWIDGHPGADGYVEGHWEYSSQIKHYPPDATSMIFWLKNRQPARWRDKQELEVGLSSNLMDLAIQAARAVSQPTPGQPPPGSRSPGATTAAPGEPSSHEGE